MAGPVAVCSLKPCLSAILSQSPFFSVLVACLAVFQHAAELEFPMLTSRASCNVPGIFIQLDEPKVQSQISNVDSIRL